MIKYKAEFYRGRYVGMTSFMSRVGWQVVAEDAKTGKRRHVFQKEYGKSPCLKSPWVASHYISGTNKYGTKCLIEFKDWAEKKAAELNYREVQNAV